MRRAEQSFVSIGSGSTSQGRNRAARRAAERGKAQGSTFDTVYDQSKRERQECTSMMAPFRDGAVEHQIADEQFILGLRYEIGLGVPRDFVEAAKHYRVAGEHGFAIAQYSVGLMYNEGLGVPQDHVEGGKWIRRAADQGLVLARHRRGQFGRRQHVEHAQRRLRPDALNVLQGHEGAAFVAGVVALLIAVPVVSLIHIVPLVGSLIGGGTALIFGLSVGLGVRSGALDVKRGYVIGPGS